MAQRERYISEDYDQNGWRSMDYKSRLSIAVVQEPESVQSVIDTARDCAVVVYLNSDGENQRLLDFIKGAAYALGGSLYQVNQEVYVIAPKGCAIMELEEGYE